MIASISISVAMPAVIISANSLILEGPIRLNMVPIQANKNAIMMAGR